MFISVYSEKNFIEKVIEHMPDKIQVHTAKELEELITNSEEICVEREEFHDFISQTEQELALHSHIFLSSVGSTWSMSVDLERRVYGLTNTFDIQNSKIL